MSKKEDKHSVFLAHDESGISAHGDSGHSNIDHHEHDHAHGESGHSHDHGAMLRETSGKVLFWCLIAQSNPVI